MLAIIGHTGTVTTLMGPNIMKNILVLAFVVIVMMTTARHADAQPLPGFGPVWNGEQTLDCEPMDDGGYDCKDDIP
jgi:hypothetical protein